MSLLSISQLSELSGKARATITKRLNHAQILPVEEKKNARFYESKYALNAIFTDKTFEYILEEERARLSFHQANKAALEEKVLKGELIPAEEVLAGWEKIAIAFRSKMLALPSKTAHKMLNIQEYSAAESIIKAEVYEALTELSKSGQK